MVKFLEGIQNSLTKKTVSSPNIIRRDDFARRRIDFIPRNRIPPDTLSNAPAGSVSTAKPHGHSQVPRSRRNLRKVCECFANYASSLFLMYLKYKQISFLITTLRGDIVSLVPKIQPCNRNMSNKFPQINTEFGGQSIVLAANASTEEFCAVENGLRKFRSIFDFVLGRARRINYSTKTVRAQGIWR